MSKLGDESRGKLGSQFNEALSCCKLDNQFRAALSHNRQSFLFQNRTANSVALSYNRRGQIGKIITTFPVMLAIFFVMLIFVVLAALMSGTRGASLPEAYVSTPGEFFLLNGFELTYKYLSAPSEKMLLQNDEVFWEHVKDKESCLSIYGLESGGGYRQVFACDYNSGFSPIPCESFSQYDEAFYINGEHLTRIPLEIKNSAGEVRYDGIAFYEGECIHQGLSDRELILGRKNE